MARKIASILEGGDPTQKGSSKFEKQRQRVEKYTVEAEKISAPRAPPQPQPSMMNQPYRPLRPLQTHDAFYSSSAPIPNCIRHSLEEAQYINPLRYVGAPEEFKQIHLQVRRGRRTDGMNFPCLLGTRHPYACSAPSSDESRR